MRNGKRKFRGALLGFSLAGALVYGTALPAPAGAVESRETHQFDIKPQPLASALLEFSKQADRQVVGATEVLRAAQTRGVSGDLSISDALGKLLEGTGLQYELVGEHSIRIVGAANSAALNGQPTAAVTAAKSPQSQLRVANAAAEMKEHGGQLTAREASGTSNQASADDGRKGVSEIIVTAQRREERVFDVPISIVAMSGDELQRRRITDIDDLSLVVPSLNIQSSGSYQRRIILRGVSNLAGNQHSSLIGMYLDEASVAADPSYQIDLRTYDLERVEVLRGPQGTLYGEGSAGGTIRFITRNPALDRASVNADVDALFTQDGGAGQLIEGAVNVPLITNVLGLRLAGTFDRQDGWVDQPTAGRKDINDKSLADVRVKGLWKPTEQFSANAMVVIHRNDAAPNIGEDAQGNFTQRFNLTTTPEAQDDYDLYGLTLTYDFTDVRVLGASSRIKQDKEVSDYGIRYQATPPGGLYYDIYYPVFTADNTITTDELRLTSLGSGPWTWTLGGYHRHARFKRTGQQIFGIPGPPGTPLPGASAFISSYLIDSWAAFGDASYRLADRVTIGMGLRYFEDDQKDSTGRSVRSDTLNPRIYAQLRLNDAANIYASAAKGFRSGGFDGVGQSTYDPESVWTYELGTKMALADGRLSIDAAVFYSDYTNYQSFSLDPATLLDFRTRNAGDATIKGVEGGLAWQPAEHWTLSLSGNYVNAKLDKVSAAFTAHVAGDPLDMVPKYGYTVSAQRDFRWRGLPAFARVDYSEHGRMTYSDRSIGPWYASESAIINMLNCNLRVQWNARFSMELFAQNLLDDRGLTDAFDIEAVSSRSRPRTFGIGLGVAFD